MKSVSESLEMRSIDSLLEAIGDWTIEHQREAFLDCSNGKWTYTYETPEKYESDFAFDTFEECLHKLCEALGI